MDPLTFQERNSLCAYTCRRTLRTHLWSNTSGASQNKSQAGEPQNKPPPGLQPLELGGLDRRAAKPAARIFPPLSQRDARNSRQFSWHVFVNTYPEQQSRQL